MKKKIGKKNSLKNKPSIKKTKIVEKDSVVVLDIIPKKARRKRKSGPRKMYFTEDTENYIELFNKTEDKETREKIFEDQIKYPFEKLVENVFNTFKFSYFETGPLDVQKECLSHIVANIHKFEKNKGKAFSYFSIVAKNYLIFVNNTNYKKFNQTVEIGEERDEHSVQLQSEDKHYKQSEMNEFIKLMVGYWDVNVGKIFTKQRDLNIANAVIELFRNSDKIDAFNKKALYLYIREISNCRTQQITKIINKMKIFQNQIKRSYQNEGIINYQKS